MIDLRVVESGLVPVYEDTESRRVVNARELHEFLGVGKVFGAWVVDRIGKYGFEEGVDYTVCFPNLESKLGSGGHNAKDYLLTLDCAKEISMAENSERGRQVRKYFIACERKLKDLGDEVEKALTNPDTMLRIVSRWRDERNQRLALETQVKKDAPRVLFSRAVETATSTVLVGDLAKILRQNGVCIGQRRLFEWLRENGFLIKSGSSRNMPMQWAMERGFFEIKETAISRSDGTISVSKTTKITGRGQVYIVNRFLGTEISAV